jgi:hypothetical protein
VKTPFYPDITYAGGHTAWHAKFIACHAKCIACYAKCIACHAKYTARHAKYTACHAKCTAYDAKYCVCLSKWSVHLWKSSVGLWKYIAYKNLYMACNKKKTQERLITRLVVWLLIPKELFDYIIKAAVLVHDYLYDNLYMNLITG